MTLATRHHMLVRFLALAVIATCVTYMAQRTGCRADVTSEGLSRLTPATEELIAEISPERPVTVHAFVSDEVPEEYVAVRSRLLNVLHEMDAEGGDGLTVRIVAPEPYSSEAEEAAENFGITPRMLADRGGGRVGEMQVFMGLAFVSGPREEVVPFMDRGLSVEYEVARALRMVIRDEKKVVGILRTDASIMGSFDFQSMRQRPAWRIVDELKKQYEVRGLDPDKEVGEDVDVLFVPQLSSLTQAQLDNVSAYIDQGRPALITVDPLPLFDLRVSPSEPRLPPPGQQRNMFGGGFGGAQSEPKGDFLGLLRDIGVIWRPETVLYDTYQPYPIFAGLPEHVIFVGPRPDEEDTFESGDPIVDGLQEVVVLFGGEISPAPGDIEFTPLLATGASSSGENSFGELTSKHPLFGLQGPIPPPGRSRITGESHVIAARVERAGEPVSMPQGDTDGDGDGGEDGAASASAPRHVIVFADLDLFGDQFFSLYERGGDLDGDGMDDIRFDNVTMLLNAVDSLTGEEDFIELRKRRPAFRRLTKVDELTREAREERDKEIDEANARAQRELEDAQLALDQAVAAIRSREGLDETTKAIMMESAEAAENRRLAAKQTRIEQEKERAIQRTETEHRRRVGAIQDRIRLLAVLLPPIPALLLGALIFARKRRRERETIPASRRARRNRT